MTPAIPDSPAVRAIRDTMLAWPRLIDLATFATKRHGYGNTDIGHGVMYPGAEAEADGDTIPDDHVLVYLGWGAPSGEEHVVSEAIYLSTLADALNAAGHAPEAADVLRLLAP